MNAFDDDKTNDKVLARKAVKRNKVYLLKAKLVQSND